MLEYYHNLSPFLIEFTPGIGIRYYSLAYIFGAIMAYFIGVYLIRTRRWDLSEDKLKDVVFYLMLFGILLGGRFGYCLFYDPSAFISFDGFFPYWKALKIHQGGMSSHGGVIGVALCAFFYSKINRLNFFSLTDFIALGASFGLFIGRFANFINGELYGRVIKGKALLGVRFPTEIAEWLSFPETYKDKLLALKNCFPALKEFSNKRIPTVSQWEAWVEKAIEGSQSYDRYLHSVAYEILQFSGESSVREALEPILFLRHPSQIYQSLLGGALVFLIMCFYWRKKPRRPGTVALLGMASYIVLRVFTEFFRQPDSHIGFQLLGLTRGQWLSLLLISGCLFCGWFIFRKKEA